MVNWGKILFFGLTILVSGTSYGLSVQEAIQLAFDKNPITQANDLRLDATRDRARGAWLDMLPSGNLSYSRGYSDYTNINNGFRSTDETNSSGWSAGLHLNVYRGGADLNRARSAQKDVEEVEAINNSTNALIPDTRGSLASDVFDVYMQLVRIQNQIDFYTGQVQTLSILLTAASTEEQKNKIKSKTTNKTNELLSLKTRLKRASLNYEYLVKMPKPSKLDSFEAVQQSMIIPPSSEEAYQIGLVMSPDIRIAQAALGSSEYSLKAQIADSFSPRVDLHLNRGQMQSDGVDYAYESLGNSASVSISIPFGASSWAYASSARKLVEARRKDLEKESDELLFEIRDSLYPEFSSYVELYPRYLEALNQTIKDIEDVLTKIENNESVNIDYAIDLTDLQIGNFYSLLENQNQLVFTKFKIQRTIGTLFSRTNEETTVLGVNRSP